MINSMVVTCATTTLSGVILWTANATPASPTATALAIPAPCPQFARWTDYTFDRFTTSLATFGDRLLVGTLFGGAIDWDTNRDTFNKHTRAGRCLPSNSVSDVAVDRQGGYWVATDAGVGYLPNGALPGAAAHWTMFNDSNSGLTSNATTSIAIDESGDIWIGTNAAGLFHFDGRTWTSFNTQNSGLSDDFVTSIAIDLQGDLWIGVWSAGVDRFDGQTWTNFNPLNTGTPPGLCGPVTLPPDQLGLLSYFVEVEAVDPFTGDIWFSTNDDSFCVPAGHGATRFDGENWMTFTAGNSGLVDNLVHAVGIAADGAVWLGTSAGASRFHNGVWQTPTTEGVLAIANATNGLWLGTWNGLLHFNGTSFTRHTTGELADSLVSDIAIEPVTGAKWFATREGAQRLDEGLWSHFHTGNSPLIANDVRAIAFDADGAAWFGTNGLGASRFDGVNWTTYGNPLLQMVNAIARDAKDNMWFGEPFGGVVRFDGQSWSRFLTGNSGIPSNFVSDMAADALGNIWVSTVAGVGRYNGTTWTTYNTANGLPSNIVRAIRVAPDGRVWIGTNNGASVFNGSTWTNYLGAADIRAIGFGPHSQVWFSSFNSGVIRFDGVNFTLMTMADGLINYRVHAIARDHHDAVWFGTELGASAFDAPRAGDANGDGSVDVDDLIAVILSWGDCAEPCPANPCLADVAPFPVGNCTVEADDLVAVILNWG